VLPGESVACCKCAQLPSRQRPYSQPVQANLSNKSSCTDLSIIPESPCGMGGSRVQGRSISKMDLSLPFISTRRMISLYAINVLVEGSFLMPCTHLSFKVSFSEHLVAIVLCYPCTSMEKSVPESLKQGVFGEAGLQAGCTAEECRYSGLLWKDPAERSPGCTVLSISLPPPEFGREQIPSRIIGLRS